MAPKAAAAADDAGAEEQDERGTMIERLSLDLAPPWLVSLIAHLILILILAMIVTPAGQDVGRMLLRMGQSEQASTSELMVFEVGESLESMDADDSLELDSFSPVDVLELDELDGMDESMVMAEVDSLLGRQVIDVQPMFGGRSGAMRQMLLEMYGGTPQTEAAVELGLRWLARHQQRDGSWSLTGPYSDGATGENRVAATAMALLAFLGAGHTHQQGDYQKLVERGIRWLIDQQDREGFFANEGSSHQRTYAQAQSSIMVCELYAMTQDSTIRDAAQLALRYAEQAQAKEGGWRYRPREPGDTSVTGWYVMALQSGLAGGLDVDQSTFYKTREFLDAVSHDGGATYSYQPGRRVSAPMSAEGLLCRQYLGWDHDEPALVDGVSRLIDKNWMFDPGNPNVYYWYYATQVLHHFGGEPWERWNNVMREELPAMQVREGGEAGSWAPQRDRWASGSGGRLYMTCLAIYCLEVYYRHMPLYQSP